VDKAHGRIELRTLTASKELKGYLDWPYAEQVFQLERRFVRVADGRVMQEVVYGIQPDRPRSKCPTLTRDCAAALAD
jgi:hypothetical protein